MINLFYGIVGAILLFVTVFRISLPHVWSDQALAVYKGELRIYLAGVVISMGSLLVLGFI